MRFLRLSLALIVFFASPAFATPAVVGIRLPFEPATLDWNLGDVPIHVINNVVEGLFAVGAGGQVTPNEAVGYPKNISPFKWRFELRPGLKWSDGRKLVAQDYVDSWTRLLDPKTASTYAYLLFHLKDAQEFNQAKRSSWTGARAIGERTIEIELAPAFRALTSPHLSVFTHWATYPIRSDIIARFGSDWAKPGQMPFNGPYQITSYQHEAKIELEPNPMHRHPGSLKKIEFLIIQEDSTALRLYESGRLHFISDLGTLDHKALKSRQDYFSRPSPVLVYLGVDAKHPLLSAQKLRHEISQAIEREAIPKILAAPHVPAYALASPDLNPAPPAAKKVLNSELRGKKLILGYFEKGTNRTLAEYLQAQLKDKIGLDVELQGQEVKTYWKRLSQSPYPIFLNSYGPPVWDPYYYFGLLRSSNPSNLGHWADAEYDNKFDALAAKQDWNKLLLMQSKSTPVIPLYFKAYEYLMSPKLKGALLNPMTSLFLDRATLQP